MRATPLFRLSTDDTLVRRATGGDDDAFALLYDRYRLRLEAYCRGILRHDEDARDAAQNALAAAYQALRRGTHPVAFRPWLFRIAHNEAISVIRRRRISDEVPDTLAAAARGPADTLELREELTAVLDAVRALAPGARSALLLRELAGLEYPEVAQVLGTTPGGARQAVFEARVALQDDRVGRGTDCEVIRHELSVHDGRRRQSRQIRGHLRGCGSCRDWSRAQRQRRQRLALGSLPFPFAGWVAGALGGLASAGSGASLSSGLAVNAQTLAALAVVMVGASPVVTDRDRAARTGDDPPPAATATGAGTGSLASSAGPARLTTTTGAPARDASGTVFRAMPATSGSAGDGGDAERRRPGAVEQTGTRGPEGDRPAGSRYTARDETAGDGDGWERSPDRRHGRRGADGGYDHGDDQGAPRETAAPVAAHPARRPARERQPAPVSTDTAPVATTPHEPAPAPEPAPVTEEPAAEEPVAEPAPAEPTTAAPAEAPGEEA